MAAIISLSNFMRGQMCSRFLAVVFLFAQIAAGQTAPKGKTSPMPKTSTTPPTIAEAERFITQAEARLLNLWIKSGRAAWVADNFITEDTQAISADADRQSKAAAAELASPAKRYEKVHLPQDVARKFKLLKLSVDIPAPRDPASQAELSKIAASLDADYGKGTWCPDDKKENCKQLPDIEKILASSRDPQELLTHISFLNFTYKPSDARHHQYSCGLERDEAAMEVPTPWVRNKTSLFSSLLMPLRRSISRDRGSHPTAA